MQPVYSSKYLASGSPGCVAEHTDVAKGLLWKQPQKSSNSKTVSGWQLSV